jgi:hypothetical protein
MHPLHKDWIKVPQLLEDLRGLFEELSDEELDSLKRSVVEQGRRYLEEKKSCSDRSVSEGTQLTHTNVRG